LFILEIKYQGGGGSVDEKLQTCDFKLKQYKRLFEGTGITVKFVFILCDWYKAKRYDDVFTYIRSVGCDYFFGSIPLEFLHLPIPNPSGVKQHAPA
jgi:hypothetical protein